MTGAIFVLKGDDELVEMRQEGYLLEAHLQDLLAKYPSLLAGDGVNPAALRRWLLVRREAGLADREDGGARWALDHLFLDQDAVPTLIEVFRKSTIRWSSGGISSATKTRRIRPAWRLVFAASQKAPGHPRVAAALDDS